MSINYMTGDVDLNQICRKIKSTESTITILSEDLEDIDFHIVKSNFERFLVFQNIDDCTYVSIKYPDWFE